MAENSIFLARQIDINANQVSVPCTYLYPDENENRLWHYQTKNICMPF
jgi:hypothetical protein